MKTLRSHVSATTSFFIFLTCLLINLSGCDKGDDTSVKSGGESETASGQMADEAYLNGKIYTVDKNNSWAKAFAVFDGKIIAVGSSADVAKHVDKNTKVFNLQSKMVMPGIHDMHAHPMQGGEKFKFQCGFPFTVTVDEIVAKLTECAAATPKGEWIRGGQWAMELMESKTIPHKKILDAITTEHPIYLGDSTVHGAWLNSKALEVLGITADTPD